MIPGLVAAVQEGGHIMRGGAVLPQATSACRSVVCHDSRCRWGESSKNSPFYCQPPAVGPPPDMPAP
jgi:hypothetical protein